jgi:ribonuclease P protein component
MLDKKNRLIKKKDFENVFRNGKKYGLFEDKIYLKVIDNNLKESRFGLVVSKKVSKKAVIRNKIKRRLREAIKCCLMNIKKNVDAVIVIAPGFDEENFQALKQKISKLFQKSRIINSKFNLRS